MRVLLVTAAGQRCGLPAPDVREVLRAVRLTPLPGAPSCIEGVVDVRGAVVPVLDLRARLDLPLRPLEPSDFLVIVRAGARLVALRADEVHDLVAIETDALDVLPNVVARGRSVAGAARLPDGLVLIHDPARFLSEVEAATLADALDRVSSSAGAP